MRSICKLVAMVTCVAGVAEAQPPSPPCKPALPDSSRGILRGQLLDDSTGRPLKWGVVLLLKADCRAVALGDGRFELTGIPLGDDHLEVLTGPYKRRAPLPVTVRRSDPQELVIRVVRGNRVTDCREIAACSALLDYNRAADSLDDSERLQEAALRLNVALLVADGWRLGEFAICVDEPNARVRNALMAAVPRVVRSGECSHARASSTGRPIGDLSHTATGTRAVRLTTKTVRRPDGRASAQLSSYVGPRHGMGWVCELANTRGQWTAVSCEMDWIS